MEGSHRQKAIRSKVFLGLLNVALFYGLYRWVSTNIDITQLKHSLLHIPLWAVLLSIGLNLIALCMYGLRMKMLLQKNFWDSFAVINIGYVLNTLIPLRLGELVKVWICRRRYGLSTTGIVAASVTEKLFDLLKLLLLGGMLISFAAGKFIPGGLLPSLTMLLFGVACAFWLLRYKVVLIIRLIPKASRMRRLAISLHKHADNYRLTRIFMVSLGIWAMNVLLMYATFNTFIDGVHVDVADAIALLLIISLAIAVPSAPAGIGLFEAGLVAYLTQVLHVDTEMALAAAVMFHLVITIPQMIVTVLLLIARRKTQLTAS